MITEAALSAAVLAGLTGGAHCAQMCGPIMLGLKGRRVIRVIPVSAPDASFNSALALPTAESLSMPRAWPIEQVGRIASYAALGAVFGSLGSFTSIVNDWIPLQAIAFFLFNLVIVILGAQIAGLMAHWNLPGFLARSIGHFQQQFLSRLWPPRTGKQRVLCGLGWGLIPCGLVYSVLPLALLSGSALDGATLMMFFGLGTLPVLLFIGWGGGALNQWIGNSPLRQSLQRVAGGLVIAWGFWGLLHASQVYFRPSALLLSWCASG